MHKLLEPRCSVLCCGPKTSCCKHALKRWDCHLVCSAVILIHDTPLEGCPVSVNIGAMN